jgi:hypothetical protein
MDNTFKTSDLYQASFISCRTKRPPDLELRDGRVIFAFKNDQHTYEALNEFNSDFPMGVFSFANAIKQTRTAMIRRKSE